MAQALPAHGSVRLGAFNTAARVLPDAGGLGWAMAGVGVLAVAAAVTAAHFYDSAGHSQRAAAHATPASPTHPVRPGGAPPLQHWPVQTGQTLWGIAGVVYRQPGWWPAIWAANQSTIGANPDYILPGQVLTIPNPAVAARVAAAYARAYYQAGGGAAGQRAGLAAASQTVTGGA